MYKSLIHETGQGTFRLEIRDKSGQIIYSTERATYDRARQDQVKFMYAGPNVRSGTRASKREEDSKEDVPRRKHAATVEAIDYDYDGHDHSDSSDGDIFE